MSKVIEWTEELSLDLPEIDAEHRHLVGLLGQIYELLNAGRSQDALDLLGNELLDYVHTHFSNEESFMERIGYPDLVSHRKIHKIFTGMVEEIAPKVLGGDKEEFDVLLALAWGWLYNHIMRTDRKYADFYRQMGGRA